MIFFVGLHQPNDARFVRAACISANRLWRRQSGFQVGYWIMDSGGFRIIEMHGGYPEPPEAYAGLIRRFSRNGRLLAAVGQDYMCESFMLEKTGLSIAEHQRLTIERYDALRSYDTSGVRIMPVLQGFAPEQYSTHVRQYGDRLHHRAWVGVGSLCRRNGRPAAIAAVLVAIKQVLPDLRLHGFGIKVTALGDGLVRGHLFSADSMAWSFAARREGRDRNSPIEAQNYARRVARMPVQLALGQW